MSLFLKTFALIFLFTSVTFSQESPASSKQKELTEKTAVLFREGKIDEAILVTTEFIGSLKQSKNENSDEMVTALTNLAFLKRQKILKEENLLFTKQVDIGKNPNYFDSVRNEAAEAEANLREAINISKNLGKSDSVSASLAMRELALILQKNYAPQVRDVSRKRIDEAENLFSQSLAIQEKAVGEADKITLQTLQELIKLYDRFGNYEKILTLSPKYIANSEKTYGQNNKNSLPVLEIYAETLYTLFKDDELNLIVDKLKSAGQTDYNKRNLKDFSSRKISSPTLRLSDLSKNFLKSGVTIRIPVNIEIDENGNVAKAQAEGNANTFLKQDAEELAKKTTFKPLSIGGKPSKFRGKILYTFSRTVTMF